MTGSGRPMGLFERMIGFLKGRAVLLKAINFALVGMVNVAVDACVFFLAYWGLNTSSGAAAVTAWFAEACRCGTPETITLIAANVFSWGIAVSGSYMMNSFITFAAESGRTLRWRAYGIFVLSGVAGLIAATGTLVAVAQVAPVWVAKGVAILVSFLVNFSLSHFVVFRPRRRADDLGSS